MRYKKHKKSNGNVTKLQKEEMIMASRSSNRAAVPEAKSALDKFKYEVANELGVPLSDGYNGDLTSKQRSLQQPGNVLSGTGKALGIDLSAFFC